MIFVRKLGLSIIFILIAVALYAGDAPRVVSTIPENGDMNVDPSLKEISVTFDRAMMDKSWSWSYEDANKFPEIAGEPYYAEKTRCVLPVRLEPDKEYVIWINTARFKNFKSASGIPAEPYRLAFKTWK